MTVKVKALVGGEYLDVEFRLDGSFIITNRDMDYEIAFSAMGGHDTAATYLCQGIESESIDWLLQGYDKREVEGFDGSLVKSFAIDMVDHLSGIYEEHTNETYISYVIDEARKIVAEENFGAESKKYIETLIKNSGLVDKPMLFAMGDPQHIMDLKTATREMLRMVPLVCLSAKPLVKRAGEVQTRTAAAAAYDAARTSLDAQNAIVKKYEDEWHKERDWQYRRLIHLLEARQEGRPLPDIGETP